METGCPNESWENMGCSGGGVQGGGGVRQSIE